MLAPRTANDIRGVSKLTAHLVGRSKLRPYVAGVGRQMVARVVKLSWRRLKRWRSG